VKKQINQQLFPSIGEMIASKTSLPEIDAIAYVDSFYENKKWLTYLLAIVIGVPLVLLQEEIEIEMGIPAGIQTIIAILLFAGVAYWIKKRKKLKIYPDILIAHNGQVMLFDDIVQDAEGNLKYNQLIEFDKEDLQHRFNYASLLDWVPDPDDNLLKYAAGKASGTLVDKIKPFEVKVDLGKKGTIEMKKSDYSLVYEKVDDPRLNHKVVSLKAFAKQYLTRSKKKRNWKRIGLIALIISLIAGGSFMAWWYLFPYHKENCGDREIHWYNNDKTYLVQDGDIISKGYDDIGIYPDCEIGILKIYDYSQASSKVGLMDMNGTIVTPLEYEEIEDYKEDYDFTLAQKNDQWMFIGKDGKLKDSLVYEDFKEVMSYKLYKVKQDGKWGLVGFDGEVIRQAVFEEMKSFSYGLVAVKRGEKWGYINNMGWYMIPPELDDVLDDGKFYLGFAEVVYKGKEMALDTLGNLYIYE
jgi:hypothetical protein